MPSDTPLPVVEFHSRTTSKRRSTPFLASLFRFHVYFTTIRHNRDISGAWTSFVLDKPEDFTQADVERLNNSIRNYAWAILGAQAQSLTRLNILKTGTGFDAQKQCLANIEE
ncbi:MAG: hypothetical protein AB2697_19875 [Candidatus Thiodiazotropha endolucinida]